MRFNSLTYCHTPVGRERKSELLCQSRKKIFLNLSVLCLSRAGLKWFQTGQLGRATTISPSFGCLHDVIFIRTLGFVKGLFFTQNLCRICVLLHLKVKIIYEPSCFKNYKYVLYTFSMDLNILYMNKQNLVKQPINAYLSFHQDQ